MKILHVTPYYLPAKRYGGPIRSVHGLCKALVDEGHDVCVYTTSVDGVKDSAVPENYAVIIDGVKVRYFKVSVLRRLFVSCEMLKMLKKEIINFDVVHLHTLYTCPTLFAARIAKKFGVPYLVSPRGMLIRELMELRNSVVKKVWIGLFEKTTLESSSFVHSTSDVEAKSIETFKFKNLRIKSIPNGIEFVDQNSLEISQKIESISSKIEGKPFVLFLGRINETKRIHLLIEALVHAKEVQLIIAGNDERGLSAKLKSFAEEKKVNSRVLFLGSVDDSEKHFLLDNALLLALPSYAESFGIVVLEAMLRKCAVVVTENVGLADVVQQSRAGLVVKATAVELARAIMSLSENLTETKAMGLRGFEVVQKKYCWNAIAKLMIKLYESSVEKKEVT